jgi:hypothetical protein
MKITSMHEYLLSRIQLITIDSENFLVKMVF